MNRSKADRSRVSTVLAVLAAFVLGACSQIGSCAPAPGPGTDTSLADQTMAPVGVNAGSGRIAIVFLGDSLTAGLGLQTTEAYPSQIGDLFAADGYTGIEIVNAGVSGDTTAGGRRRLPQLFSPDVQIVVVALGGNDALRGLTVEQTRANLRAIIDTSFEAGAEVLLAGMEGPTNLGEDYRERFRRVYADLAAEYGRRITYVPFLLEGVAGQPDLNQADGIHPTAEGARIVAEHLYPPLRNMVELLPAMNVSQ